MKTHLLSKSLRMVGATVAVAFSAFIINAQPPPANGGPGNPPPTNGNPPATSMNPFVGGVPAGPGPVIGISSPGSNNPAPAPEPAPAPAPAPAHPAPLWGSPWWNGWNTAGPTVVVSPSVNVTNFNNGNIRVLCCGYDAMGVWRTFPLYVNYQYNGVNYNVTVLNAWDPWTDQWNQGIDVQAFSTDYTLRGVNYNYYVVLSYGTFYFNL